MRRLTLTVLVVEARMRSWAIDEQARWIGGEMRKNNDLEQTHMAFAFPGLAQADPEIYAAQVYVNVKQLYDQAYRDLGHPAGDFDESIVRAIQMLSETPTPSADLELLRRPGYFEQADPALKSLPPVQKQLLLIGPGNRQRLIAWLRRFATALDLKIS